MLFEVQCVVSEAVVASWTLIITWLVISSVVFEGAAAVVVDDKAVEW